MAGPVRSPGSEKARRGLPPGRNSSVSISRLHDSYNLVNSEFDRSAPQPNARAIGTPTRSAPHFVRRHMVASHASINTNRRLAPISGNPPLITEIGRPGGLELKGDKMILSISDMSDNGHKEIGTSAPNWAPGSEPAALAHRAARSGGDALHAPKITAAGADRTAHPSRRVEFIIRPAKGRPWARASGTMKPSRGRSTSKRTRKSPARSPGRNSSVSISRLHDS